MKRADQNNNGNNNNNNVYCPTEYLPITTK